MSEQPLLDTLKIQGEARIEASVSMLYTDILSEELNASLGNPDTVAIIQKHLQTKGLNEIRQEDFQPLMDSVPDSFLDVAKEAAFASGALLKRVPCISEIKVGAPFSFRGTGLIADIIMKDARVQVIRPFKKRIIPD